MKKVRDLERRRVSIDLNQKEDGCEVERLKLVIREKTRKESILEDEIKSLRRELFMLKTEISNQGKVDGKEMKPKPVSEKQKKALDGLMKLFEELDRSNEKFARKSQRDVLKNNKEN